jgi:hypothetical protein
MLGLMVLIFLAGCIVGAAANDLARWHRQRSATQNLIRALDSGALHYGRTGGPRLREQEQNEPT